MTHPLLADIDVPGVVGAAAAAFVTAAGTVGPGVAWLLNHLSKQRADQREHELAVMRRVEAIAAEFRATAQQLAKDSREDSRKTLDTLLDIQKETVEAVGGLSGRVGELGHAITELRVEVGRKADRRPDDPGSHEHPPLPPTAPPRPRPRRDP